MAKDKKAKKKDKKAKKKAAKLEAAGEKLKKDGKKAKAALDDRAGRVAEALKAEVQKAGVALSGAKDTVAKAASAAVKKEEAAAPKHTADPQLESFEMPSEETLFNLANLFKIFSDPTRLKILFSLVDGPRCVADISEAAGVTQGATSHQLRSMKQERLVDFERDGKQVFYSLADGRVQTLLAKGLSCIDE